MDGLAAGAAHTRATLGVEEEFLLFDRETCRPVGRGGWVVAEGRQRLRSGQLVPELSQAMVETVSSVCGGGPELHQELLQLRQAAERAAQLRGCVLVASGTSPVGLSGPRQGSEPPEVPGLSDHPRYARIRQHFGPLVQDQGVCACHVHVGVPDLATAVAVVDHLRPWLPLLLALTANSPFWQGADTGYASWRTMVWGRWPTAGPPPLLRTPERYEETVQALVGSGAVLDPAMLYWYARPSRHVPTVEVRIADVLPTASETVAYALLVRALVARVRAAIEEGRPAPRVEQVVLGAACWQAAHEGVTGHLIDLTGDSAALVTPVAEQIGTLRVAVAPYVDREVERAVVDGWLAGLAGGNGGAERQRAACAAAGGPDGLIAHLALGARTHGPGRARSGASETVTVAPGLTPDGPEDPVTVEEKA